MALGIMDAEYKPNMTEEKARDLAIRAIKSSVQRDSSSGDGIDILMLTDNQPREQSLPI
jgi:proteasome beta subunit